MDNNVENTDFPRVDREGVDLVVYQCGMEKCKSSHSYGPALRDHFLIHYILEGEGKFYVDDNCYKLSKNQGFLICPDVITYYEADNKNPWYYTWVGFKGMKAESYLRMAGLSRENPIFTFEDDMFIRECFDAMRRSVNLKYGGELKSQGLLSIFLSELIESSGKQEVLSSNYKEIYIKKALQFVEANYSRDISIKAIAEYVGLQRNYFSSLIKEELGISLQEYLIKFRINKACELMRNKNLSIGDIARSVGYSDPLGFSKIFKKVKCISPKEYREGITNI